MHESRYLFIGTLFLLSYFPCASAAHASAQEHSGTSSPLKTTAVKITQPSSNSSTFSTELQEKAQAAHVAATPVPNLENDPYEGWQPGMFIIPGTNTQVPCKYLLTSFSNLSLCITQEGMFERTNCTSWKPTGRTAPAYKPALSIQIAPSTQPSGLFATLKSLLASDS